MLVLNMEIYLIYQLKNYCFLKVSLKMIKMEKLRLLPQDHLNLKKLKFRILLIHKRGLDNQIKFMKVNSNKENKKALLIKDKILFLMKMIQFNK